MGKTKKGFNDSLAYISLFGFLVLAINSFTSFDLSPWTTTFFMVVAGAGLMLEGRVTTIVKWAKDGFQGPELTYLFTIIFGMFMIVVGILVMPGIALVGPKIQTVVGIASIFSMVVIVIQKWFFD